jgi:hypothetical protein
MICIILKLSKCGYLDDRGAHGYDRALLNHENEIFRHVRESATAERLEMMKDY